MSWGDLFFYRIFRFIYQIQWWGQFECKWGRMGRLFFFPWSLTLQNLFMSFFLILWALLYIIIIEGKDSIMYEFLFIYLLLLFFYHGRGLRFYFNLHLWIKFFIVWKNYFVHPMYYKFLHKYLGFMCRTHMWSVWLIKKWTIFVKNRSQ